MAVVSLSLVLLLGVVHLETWNHTQGRVRWALFATECRFFSCPTLCAHLTFSCCGALSSCLRNMGQKMPFCQSGHIFSARQLWRWRRTVSKQQVTDYITLKCDKVLAAVLVLLEYKKGVQKADLQEMHHDLFIPPSGFSGGIIRLEHLISSVYTPHLRIVGNNAAGFRDFLTPSPCHLLHGFSVHGGKHIHHLAALPFDKEKRARTQGFHWLLLADHQLSDCHWSPILPHCATAHSFSLHHV